jgi:hypothetical protein
MYALNSVPMTTWDEWNARRQHDPTAILPMPGEPVVTGDLPNTRKVWANDGRTVGWYHIEGDLFTPCD